MNNDNKKQNNDNKNNKEHQDLRGNPKREKTTDGDERRIHYDMGEYKTDLRAMCSRKRSERDYKSLRTLSHKNKNSKT